MPIPVPARPAANAPPIDTAVVGKRPRLSDGIYGQIFEAIVGGELNVGDQLPSENDIARQYDVSRPVVREALQRLRADGLVTAHQGLGSFVSAQPAPRLKALAAADNVALFLRCQEVRIALEGESARLAALRRDHAQMRVIDAAQARFKASADAGQIDAEEDLAFHRAIAQATNNDFFAQALDSTHEAMAGFMRLTISLTRSGSARRAQKVLEEHTAIVEAIRARDGERARTAMQFHLDQARQRLINRERDA
ncbi:MAG: FadR family transcriptional regulator [Burkholderiales bacterium]|nr:FadR family transcriptional regulator [Burkholderiales bacterium]